MSPLALLGAAATVLSTITLIPHVVHAARNRRPGGSTFGWTVGACSSTMWVLYGLAAGDMTVAAPGVITVPAGITLATWCAVHAHRERRIPIAEVSAPEMTQVFVPAPSTMGDTLEMPRIVA